MTDKEFKRLSRAQLIDIIYQYQLRQDELTEENERLSKALEDKRIRITEAGNLAEAAMEIHKVMEAAQNAANHYIEEMQQRVDDECKRILDGQQEQQKQWQKESQAAASVIIRQAKQEAIEIIEQAKAEAKEIRAQARSAAAEVSAAAAVVQARKEKEKAGFDPVEAILREYRKIR
ncbi:MAG: PhoH family protein [Clostridia bacterium]|nr:PhoH family protein [Clostridia bacterium]